MNDTIAKLVSSVCLTLSLVSCGRSSGERPSTTTSTGTGASSAVAATCTPPGLEGARPVTPWRLGPGCQRSGPPSDGAPIFVRNAEELRAQITCAGTVPTVDFSRYQLVIQQRMLPPAYAGGEIVDDGRKVTFVSHYREPCGDLGVVPMPAPDTFTFLLPAGETREFADAACTLETHCP